MNTIDQCSGESWMLYNGDSCEVMPSLPDKSVDLVVTSIPFLSLYVYSDTPRDIGNCATLEEFLVHFRFIVQELLRVMRPGRNVCVHIQDVVSTQASDGIRGIKDFTGPVADLFQEIGFAYCGKVPIDKNPQMQAARNKVHELMFATKNRDACSLVPVMIEYVMIFKAPGKNLVPVVNPIDNETWIDWAHGIWPDDGRSRNRKALNPDTPYVEEWEPRILPFYDIRETDVLNSAVARDSQDERHMCVARGSMVLTRDGYIPIECVEPGDMVVTHEGRWRPVIATRCMGVKPVVKLSGQGIPGLRVTADHRVYARRGNGPEAKSQAKRSVPQWTEASETLGSYLNLKLPAVEDSPLTESEWWIIGRWLGDGHIGGHIRTGKRGGSQQYLISCSEAEHEGLIAQLGDYAGHSANTRTGYQIALRDPNRRLRSVLTRCGHGAATKRLPSEAICLCPEKAESLLCGYISADGHYVEKHDRYVSSSVSRSLLLGMAMVAQRARSVVASVYAGRPARQTTIEGRGVNTQQDWVFAFRNSDGYRKSGWIDDGAWKKVRAIHQVEETAEVWDLQVAEDESFTVEGCIVHNCPLQLGLIERLVRLYTNPGEVVLDPFNGIGSSGYEAVRMDRRYIGIELKPSYYRVAARNLRNAESANLKLDLFTEAIPA